MGSRINFTSSDPDICKLRSGDDLWLRVWAIERPGGENGSPHLHSFTAELIGTAPAERTPACPACNEEPGDWVGDKR